MKLKLYLLFFLLCSLVFKSQTTVVYGIIKDAETNFVIKDAVIKCLNSPSVTQTNLKGEFSLTLTKKENYKLSISHISYQSFIKEVKTVKNNYLLMRLKIKCTPFLVKTSTIILNK